MPKNPKKTTYPNRPFKQIVGDDGWRLIDYYNTFSPRRGWSKEPFAIHRRQPHPPSLLLMIAGLREFILNAASKAWAAAAPWDSLPPLLPASARERLLVPSIAELMEEYLIERQACRTEREHRRLVKRVKIRTVFLVLDCVRVVLLEYAAWIGKWFIHGRVKS